MASIAGFVVEKYANSLTIARRDFPFVFELKIKSRNSLQVEVV